MADAAVLLHARRKGVTTATVLPPGACMHRFQTIRLGLARQLACLGLALLATMPAGAAERSATLLAEHAALQAGLRDSPFGEPLLLRTGGSDALHTGEVMAVLPRTLASVAAALRSPASLCAVLVLHLNVRGCQPVAGAEDTQLQVSVGPMRSSLPGLLQDLRLTLQLVSDTPGLFSTRLAAPEGPLGSSDLQVQVEAVEPAPGQTYLHIHYSQASGVAARMATRLYLATAGRNKIGFSSMGLDAAGRPRPVDGEQAALERNVMRHYLALLACTSVVGGTPAARMDARLRAWHALTERHAAQLHELDLASYLAEKRGAVVGLR